MKSYSVCAFLIFICCVHITCSISAQNQALSLNKELFLTIEYQSLKNDLIVHRSLKPITQKDLKDSLYLAYLSIKKVDKSFVSRKLFHEHLIQYDSGGVQFSIDPLLNLEIGRELADDPRDINLYKNMRGFMLRLNLGQKVSIESSFRENQANLPYYLSLRTRRNNVAYGQGRVKSFEEGYDFNMASSRITYTPTECLNIQLGHDKHFIGNGERSLLLSDLSFNYPFIRLQSEWLNGKLKYQNLFTLFQDIERLPGDGLSESLFSRKQGVFHHLSFSPNSVFNIGLFEGMIFPSLDSSGNVGVPVSYWLPLMYLNSLTSGSKRNGNTLLGLDWSLELFKKVLLYGQGSLFDERLSNLSLQAGVKWFAHTNLSLQLESNMQFFDKKENLFMHYSESLNSPVLTEHNEFLVGINWQRKRILAKVHANYIETNFEEIKTVNGSLSYMVNPASSLKYSLGYLHRESENKSNQQSIQPISSYFYFSLSTSLQNLYFNY